MCIRDREYTVRSNSEELGTIVMPPPVGEKIAIAGHVWIVEEVDHKRHLVYCEQVRGKVPAYFGQCPGDINTKVDVYKRQTLRSAKSAYIISRSAAPLPSILHIKYITFSEKIKERQPPQYNSG